MCFSKNKFKKVSSGVVLSGVSLCSSLYSIGNVCSAGQAAVAKSSLSGLGAKNLSEETAKKVVSDVSTNKILLYFGAAVIVCVAAVMIWRYIKNNSVGGTVGANGSGNLDVNRIYGGTTRVREKNLNIDIEDEYGENKFVSDEEKRFGEGFMKLAGSIFKGVKPQEYGEDFKKLLDFTEGTYIELGLELEGLSIKTETLFSILDKKSQENFERKFLNKPEYLKVTIRLDRSKLILIINGKENLELHSLRAKVNIENYIEFLNYFFEKSSEKNGWEDKLKITYNENANEDERIKIARVKRESKEVVKESFLKDVFYKKEGNDFAYLYDEDFAIVNQNRSRPFEKVFFFTNRPLPEKSGERQRFLDLLKGFEGRIFEINKKELKFIVDRNSFLDVDELVERSNKYPENSNVKIRIAEVDEEGFLGLKIVEGGKESTTFYTNSVTSDFYTNTATSDMEKVEELANYLENHELKEEKNEENNIVNNNMSKDSF